jgi:hypothetical protein
LPPIQSKLMKYLPPQFSAISPDYSTDFTQLTGWLPFQEIVYALRLTSNHADDARHSFVQDVGSGPFGIHVNGADRISGDYASISPWKPFATRAPAAPGAADGRVFPWARDLNSDMRIGFAVAVKTIRRADASSHAYGHPLLDLQDSASGHHVLVTLQAFGTVPAGDFVGRDVNTGATIVSTVFRADPLFGKRLAGDYIACTADAASGSCPGGGFDANQGFVFTLDGHDFAHVLALARGVDPALSARPQDYELAAYAFHVETYRDAEVGLEVDQPTLSVTY